jgi:hypothetical protein
MGLVMVRSVGGGPLRLICHGTAQGAHGPVGGAGVSCFLFAWPPRRAIVPAWMTTSDDRFTGRGVLDALTVESLIRTGGELEIAVLISCQRDHLIFGKDSPTSGPADKR